MTTKDDAIAWLRWCTEDHQARRIGMSEAVEDLDDVGKLGHGFASVDELEEVDIGDGNVKQPTYMSVKLHIRKGCITY
jgi:hypothetical protein